MVKDFKRILNLVYNTTCHRIRMMTEWHHLSLMTLNIIYIPLSRGGGRISLASDLDTNAAWFEAMKQKILITTTKHFISIKCITVFQGWPRKTENLSMLLRISHFVIRSERSCISTPNLKISVKVQRSKWNYIGHR